MALQKCTGPCGLEKELNTDNFYVQNNKFKKQCKKCMIKSSQKNHIKKTKESKIIIINDVNFQKCTKCNELKELNEDNFIWAKEQKYWVGKCRKCSNKKRRINNIIIFNEIEFLKCEKCGILKELNEKNYYRQKKDYWRKKCQDCFSKEAKEKYIKKPRKKYKKTNIVIINCVEYIKCSGVCGKLKIANKENFDWRRDIDNWRTQCNECRRQYHRELLRNNIFLRVRSFVSRSIYNILKSSGNSKLGSSVAEYLNILAIKNHLISKYEFWMKDKNQGVYSYKTWDDKDPSTWTWQIDHIIPQSDLPYTEMSHDPESNFQKAWALSNLRPLSAKQNILDGAKRTRHKKVSK